MAYPNFEKTPGSGRKKGTPNKKKSELEKKAHDLGVDPFKILLLFAKGDWEALNYPGETTRTVTKFGMVEKLNISVEVRMKAAAEACQYINPKLKSIEGHLEVNEGVKRPLAHLTDEELDSL